MLKNKEIPSMFNVKTFTIMHVLLCTFFGCIKNQKK